MHNVYNLMPCPLAAGLLSIRGAYALFHDCQIARTNPVPVKLVDDGLAAVTCQVVLQ